MFWALEITLVILFEHLFVQSNLAIDYKPI